MTEEQEQKTIKLLSPMTGILNHCSGNSTNIPTKSETDAIAIRRPHETLRYQAEIDKTIEKAQIEGKRPNTLNNFYHKLRQLTRICDLMNPEDVKRTIGYSKLSNSSKCTFALAYHFARFTRCPPMIEANRTRRFITPPMMMRHKRLALMILAILRCLIVQFNPIANLKSVSSSTTSTGRMPVTDELKNAVTKIPQLSRL
jgi:hypothetical protein